MGKEADTHSESQAGLAVAQGVSVALPAGGPNGCSDAWRMAKIWSHTGAPNV